MSVILLQVEAARETLSGNDGVSESVTAIQESAQTAVALTRQLLAFGRKHESKSEFLDLNSVLTGCEKLVRSLIGEDIDLVVRHGRDLPLVEVDPGQVYQIVMNFAVNARDAMPHGGILTIESAAVHESAAASIPDAKPGPYVSLTVSDNGLGMDAETQSRVFEPFFTTKEIGRGTGLGLSIVHGIVKESGGHITVHSEPGHGAEFRVYFPAA